MRILIIFLFLLSIQVNQLDSMVIKRENQVWNEMKTRLSNLEKPTAIDDWSPSDNISRFCVPLLNCSSDINRILAVFLAGLCISSFYCVYQIRECRQNNLELMNLT